MESLLIDEDTKGKAGEDEHIEDGRDIIIIPSLQLDTSRLDLGTQIWGLTPWHDLLCFSISYVHLSVCLGTVMKINIC